MKAKKSLGQHFLRCRWVVSTMIHAAKLNPNDAVLEIGPGTGVLTKALAKNAGRVLAIEKDKRMAEELKKSLNAGGFSNVEMAIGDVLKYVPDSIWNTNRAKHGAYKIVANIPYYLTSRLLRLIFEGWPKPELIVLTVQKEVAKRIVARPPKMNLLAFSVQFFGKPEIIKTIPQECFYPRPEVESAIIKITPHKERPANREIIFKIARAIFSSPRKTILNNLSRLFGKEAAKKLLDGAKIEHRKRGGELSVEDIIRISYVPN